VEPKSYVKTLLSIWAFIATIAFGYIFYFNAYYPIPLTNHISFDAKVKFVREKIDPNLVDTMIIGSSIGLNNILGVELDKNAQSVQKTINMSVYGATTLQAEQLMELMETFPNLKRIIYSVQYSDTPHNWRFKDYDPGLLIRYMRHEQSTIKYLYTVVKACVNIPFCYNRQQTYKSEHLKPNVFESLLFDASGSVPLKIYGKDIIGHRWRLAQPNIMSPKSFEAIRRMALKAKSKGIKYYIVHQPYRKELYDKHAFVRAAMKRFDDLVSGIFQKTDGVLITTQHLGLHGNKDFADRTHLNIDGAKTVSRYVAKKIDELEVDDR